MNKEKSIEMVIKSSFVFGGHQNKKCDFYYKYRYIQKCCSVLSPCPNNLPQLKCPKYDSNDCCEFGGNILIPNSCSEWLATKK